MIKLISVCNLSNFCFFFLLLLFNHQIRSIVYVTDASNESVRQFVCTWNNVDYIIGIRLTFQFILDVISYCGFRATLFAKNRRRNSKQSNWNTCNTNVTKTSKRFHFFFHLLFYSETWFRKELLAIFCLNMNVVIIREERKNDRIKIFVWPNGTRYHTEML